MFCVVLLVATLTLVAADFLSSQQNSKLIESLLQRNWQENHNENEFIDIQDGGNYNDVQVLGQYNPKQPNGLFQDIWKMATDKTGHVMYYEDGEPTENCEATLVTGRYVEGPYHLKFYGPYNKKILYLGVKPFNEILFGAGVGGRRVKLLLGGMSYPFAVIAFRNLDSRTDFTFVVKVCW